MQFVLYVFLAFVCEYVDSTLGMGYGTTLTPLLLFIGFDPLQIVPAVLFSEFVTGILVCIFHHRFGNVFFDFRSDDRIRRSKLGFLGYIPRSFDAKITYMLIVMGVIGVLIAVFFSLNVSKFILKLYIGLMIFFIGIYILFRMKKPSIFRWRKFIIIAILSGFNKGASGGGYGPLVTGGQVVSGRSAKSSVGSTSLAEGIVCFVGFFAYLFARGRIHWTLALPMLLGAVLSTPFSAYTVNKVPEKMLKVIIGLVTILLGILTLIKVF